MEVADEIYRIALSPDSGISDREIVLALLYRLGGRQAKDAIGQDFGWEANAG
ncbi:hypothetical protein [Sinorhizobium fredii]|uniref:hypothetical protein n=1 Tax=Rhizobium fredii TaxID=380 RepID=UPI0004AD4552|nr:hypothetical protein [Sinorhizobium fredii]AWM27688.1 hypothetical protein AOX55_00004909 [Sinorhizobium fredii CCBAU 25509]